jgi:hypothetical protein
MELIEVYDHFVHCSYPLVLQVKLLRIQLALIAAGGVGEFPLCWQISFPE